MGPAAGDGARHDRARAESRPAPVAGARAAGAVDLACRAEAHTQTLMDQGRQLWEELGQLGQQFRDLDQQLDALHRSASQQQKGRSLDEDWALFEARQELEELRRRQGLD